MRASNNQGSILDGFCDARQSTRRRNGEVHDEALRTQITPELLAEQRLDIGRRTTRTRTLMAYSIRARNNALPGRTMVNSVNCPGPSDVNSTTVLFHDNVVRHRETKAGSFTGWLGREKRVEYLFP